MLKDILHINIDSLRDMKSMSDYCNIREIVKCGNKHIDNGGVVVIQQEYSHKEPTEVVSLNNNDSFNEWTNNFFEVNKSNTEGTPQ